MSAAVPAPPKPRRRVQLDAGTIIDAALRLASAGGEDALTFRKLGAELGADPTAVYRHFRDKSSLFAAMLDRLLGEIWGDLDRGLPWRERLVWAAHATLQILAAHPVVGVRAGSLTTAGAAELDAMEEVLAALAEAGLSGEQLVRFYGLYSSHVLSFSAAMAAGRLSDGTALDDDDRWVPPLGRVDGATHPHLAREAQALGVLRSADVFGSGLDLILDSVEAVVSATVPGAGNGGGSR